MTKEEIKEQVSMPELMRKYGIEISRNRMCKCPFHADNSPSMKVFNDGCHCFTCNRSWDIFQFVQEIDNCDFRTAFLSLGGTYATTSGDGDLLRRARIERKRKQMEQEARDKADRFHEFIRAMEICKCLTTNYSYPSTEWCDGMLGLEMIDRQLDLGKEDITQDVYKRCILLRQKYIDIT